MSACCYNCAVQELQLDRTGLVYDDPSKFVIAQVSENVPLKDGLMYMALSMRLLLVSQTNYVHMTRDGHVWTNCLSL